MKCNCIEQVKKSLVEKTGDPEARIDVGHQRVGNKFVSIPLIRATYRKKKPNGEFNKKIEYTPILINYCPICGKAVNDGAKPESHA